MSGASRELRSRSMRWSPPAPTSCRGSSPRSRSGWPRSRATTGRCSRARPARRSRPAASACARCSSCLAAGRPAAETRRLVRAAAAVELVHAATLVHDDVLDRAALRRGRPTVVATGGRLAGHRHRRSAVLARVRRAGRARSRPRRSASCRAACSAAGRGRADAAGRRLQARRAVERYLERCRLKTAVLFRAACELGALAGGGIGRRARPRSASDRPRLPDPRRRPRRHRPAGADRQAARDRPARRHGDAAADPRSLEPIPRWRRSICARCGRPRTPRRCATGSPRPARWRQPASGRWRWCRRRRRTCRRCSSAQRAASGARRRRGRRALQLSASRRPRSPRGGSGRLEGGDEALDSSCHVGLRQALQIVAACPRDPGRGAPRAHQPASVVDVLGVQVRSWGTRGSSSQQPAAASLQATGCTSSESQARAHVEFARRGVVGLAGIGRPRSCDRWEGRCGGRSGGRVVGSSADPRGDLMTFVIDLEAGSQLAVDGSSTAVDAATANLVHSSVPRGLDHVS